MSGNQHQRFGFGLEFWTENLKFSANNYYRLSGWKASNLLKGSDERVANGYDLNLDAYLPSYPKLVVGLNTSIILVKALPR
ncbi:inverse autotransporter beta domain-containing protein [Sodalis ligni]|nr:inverse autotransporter beta domain-containing protein [Sodalis ligni]